MVVRGGIGLLKVQGGMVLYRAGDLTNVACAIVHPVARRSRRGLSG